MLIPQRTPTWKPFILITLVTFVFLALFLRTELVLTGGQLGVPLDDAWIHYQYARNISQGHGFSYNPGEPMPGSTAPLWTLMLAGAGLFTEDFLAPSLALSAFFLLLTVWLTFGLAYALADHLLPALLAATAVALSGRMLWAGLAGMETTAFAAVSLAAVWAYRQQGLRPLPALLFALASQLRPEGHALFALAIGDTLLATRFGLAASNHGGRWRSLLVAVSIYALVAAPYAIFSLLTTGHPLPNTFYAKAGSQYFYSFRTLRETISLHWWDNPIAALVLPLGLIPAWRRGRLVLAWFFALLLVTPFIVDQVWHHGRYTLPLIPFQMIIAALGVHWLYRQVSRQRIAVAALLALLLVAGGLWRLPDWARMLGHNVNEIIQIDVAMGHWLAENTPAGALIAVDDIGAITFISQRRILDLNGLVSPEMWPVIRGEKEGRPRNEAAARLLSQLKPDYMAVFPVWHWEIATNPIVATPIERFWVETKTIIGEQEAVIYKMEWPYLAEAAPTVSRQAVLGEAIQLLGYDLVMPEDKGHPLRLALYWQSLAAVNEGYDVFVHVLDGNGAIVAQADSEPVGILAPTHRWQPGDVIRDPYELWLPGDLPPGEYRIQTGMYLRETGVRLPAAGDNVMGGSIFLTALDWSW